MRARAFTNTFLSENSTAFWLLQWESRYVELCPTLDHYFQIFRCDYSCSLNIGRGETSRSIVGFSACPTHSFDGKLLNKNWVGFADQVFPQQCSLDVAVQTCREGTHSLWRALCCDTWKPMVPIIARGSSSHSAFEGIESKWQFQR